MGKPLKEKISGKSLDELCMLAIQQNFLPSNFCAIQVSNNSTKMINTYVIIIHTYNHITIIPIVMYLHTLHVSLPLNSKP